MAESIKMPFQVVNLWGLRNSVLDGGPYPPQERGTFHGDILGHAQQSVYSKYLTRGQHTAMRPAGHCYYGIFLSTLLVLVVCMNGCVSQTDIAS